MSTFTVTIRRLGAPPHPYFAIGSTSAAVAENAAHRHGPCGITVTPLNKKGSTMAHAKRTQPGTGALFIHGPQGCGKTRHSAALCRFFGKRRAVDFDDGPDRAQADYESDLIVFSHYPLPGSMPFSTAMASAGIAA